MTPFLDAIGVYPPAGWPGIMPLGSLNGQIVKSPPPSGFTGLYGKTADENQLRDWADVAPDRNVGLRLPRGVVGIDIDQYDSKHGDDTVRRLEGEWGPLPAAPYSTARGAGASGIRVFRAPADIELAGQLPGGSVEIVQWKHRYMVVSPSIHPDTGTQYRWYNADDSERVTPPSIESLPWLPETWVFHLKVVARQDFGLADDDETRAMLNSFKPGPPCTRVRQVVDRTRERFTTESAFETARSAIWELVKLGTDEHKGITDALNEIGEMYADEAGSRRGWDAVRREWHRLLEGAYRKIAAEPPKNSVIADFEKCRCSTGGIRTKATPERMAALMTQFA